MVRFRHELSRHTHKRIVGYFGLWASQQTVLLLTLVFYKAFTFSSSVGAWICFAFYCLVNIAGILFQFLWTYYTLLVVAQPEQFLLDSHAFGLLWRILGSVGTLLFLNCTTCCAIQQLLTTGAP